MLNRKVVTFILTLVGISEVAKDNLLQPEKQEHQFFYPKTIKTEVMNKRLVVFLALALISNCEVSFSQVNSYLLNSPVWKLRCITNYPANCLKKDHYNYYVNGDTLINSLIYKRIYRKGHYTHTDLWGTPSANCPGANQYINTLPEFFLRSAGKQMFVLFMGSNNEQFLYDFNLQVGDTLPLSAINSATNITVSAIDSISTPYGYRKRFALSDNNNHGYLLEGIGYSYGLVEPAGPHLGTNYWLDCFSLNGNAYFPSTGLQCDVGVGIQGHEKKISLTPFPNPFVTSATIQFNSSIDAAQLNIYDHVGQNVSTVNDFSGDKLRIERGSLNSGLYFYEVVQNARCIATGKLIVAD